MFQGSKKERWKSLGRDLRNKIRGDAARETVPLKNVYDIYGNYHYTPEAGFSVENGEIYFYPEDLAGL